MTVEEFSAYVSGREFPETAQVSLDEDGGFTLKMELMVKNSDLVEHLNWRGIPLQFKVEISGSIDKHECIGQVDDVNMFYRKGREEYQLQGPKEIAFALDDLLELF